ncbi:MAG: HNH endonuclease [Alphaproteobacteria bacterium]|nr:HNH endonuclease [Alphaproteobacteria bacterium]
MTVSLETCPALVLNADYRPLSYFPLSLWQWQDAVKAAFLERVDIVSEYDRVVRSPSHEIRLPSVIALKEYVPMARRPAFTRFNVFLRDGFACQYCSGRFPVEDLTFDHVIPRSRGGRTMWSNVVTACSRCNLAKADQMPRACRMHPRIKPIHPSTAQLHESGRSFPPRFLHESWRDYLYWDSELEAE